MRLSKKEQAVLAAVEFDADSSLSDFEKPLRMPVSTIRYHVNNLLSRGVIRYYPFVNTLALGFTPYSLFFSLSAHGRKTQDKVIASLQRRPEVSWCAQMGGPYHFCATILTKSLEDVTRFTNKFCDEFGDLFSRKQIAGQTSFTLFQTKYLYETRKADRVLTWSRTVNAHSLDELDAQILSGLISPTFVSRRELARSLGTPIGTVDSRVRKLREHQIIQGALYLINPQNLSMHCYKLLIHTRGFSSALDQELFKFCLEHRNITTLIRCVGNWDYEIGVEVSTPDGLLDITHILQVHFGESIVKIEELTQFRDLKVNCFPFIPPAARRRARA